VIFTDKQYAATALLFHGNTPVTPTTDKAIAWRQRIQNKSDFHRHAIRGATTVLFARGKHVCYTGGAKRLVLFARGKHVYYQMSGIRCNMGWLISPISPFHTDFITQSDAASVYEWTHWPSPHCFMRNSRRWAPLMAEKPLKAPSICRTAPSYKVRLAVRLYVT
jgi:hypothetical protein